MEKKMENEMDIYIYNECFTPSRNREFLSKIIHVPGDIFP